MGRWSNPFPQSDSGIAAVITIISQPGEAEVRFYQESKGRRVRGKDTHIGSETGFALSKGGMKSRWHTVKIK